MDDQKMQTALFEANRAQLRAVAYRMLGSASEAEDAVQEAWLRFSRAGADGVDNLGGWLTTIVARTCLDMLRARKSRREDSLEDRAPDLSSDESVALADESADPERETLLSDSIGVALLVVLETLTPSERVAFVLHDMFDLSFDEIAPIVERTPTAARQLASRARRRVQGARPSSESDRTRRREVIDAFLAASRGGDFSALLAVLDPNVVLRADRIAVEVSQARQAAGALKLAPEIRGAAAVAETFKGRAQAAQVALVNGAFGLVWAPGGQVRSVFEFTIAGGRIVEIDLVADPEELAQFDVAILK
jgi:RNA polymerase sigma-70 factor (ECF subfamily)